MRFFRIDANPCAQVVRFDKLNVSAELPVKAAKVIALKIEEPGEYDFNCQMGMYRGKLVVEA